MISASPPPLLAGMCNDATGVRRRTSLGKRSLSDALASQIDATAPVFGDGHKLIHVEDAYAALGKEKKTNPYCSLPVLHARRGQPPLRVRRGLQPHSGWAQQGCLLVPWAWLTARVAPRVLHALPPSSDREGVMQVCALESIR